MSPALIEKFSKRHQEIDQKTRELLERQPEKANGNIAVIRDHIAHKERARKIKGITLPELQTSWDRQLTDAEKSIAWPTGYGATVNCGIQRGAGGTGRHVG